MGNDGPANLTRLQSPLVDCCLLIVGAFAEAWLIVLVDELVHLVSEVPVQLVLCLELLSASGACVSVVSPTTAAVAGVVALADGSVLALRRCVSQAACRPVDHWHTRRGWHVVDNLDFISSCDQSRIVRFEFRAPLFTSHLNLRCIGVCRPWVVRRVGRRSLSSPWCCDHGRTS